MPSASRDGVQIHYELAGSASPLVLIGGLSVHTGEYRALIDALARQHRVIAPDNRGAGLSDKPDEAYSYAMMSADALAVMDAAGVPSAHIVGFSMGASIALELCLAHPERVRTLTLIAGSAKERSRRRTRLLAGLAAVVARDAGHGIRHQFRARRGYDATRRLGDVDVPTLVLHAQRDRLVAVAHGRELARLIPDAQFQLMPGGHLGCLRVHALAYAERIDAFSAHD